MLLMVFLFNVAGYYIVFWALRFQANQEISTRIEANQFNENEVISLKIPMKLPYLNDDADYRSAAGEIEHNGEYYKLVKQKQEGDTLIIVCVKNHEEKQLVKRMIDYANLSNDFSTQSKETQSLLNKLVKEYEPSQGNAIISSQGWVMTHIRYSLLSFSIDTFELDVHIPPPRRLS